MFVITWYNDINIKCRGGDNVVKNVTVNAKVMTNSLDDGHVTIKMATVGERNENGLIIETDKSLTYNNSDYPLFFEHKRDLTNLIGTFQPIEPNGNDLLADAIITDPKAQELVKSGALHNASITYVMTDYVYNEDQDAIIVKSGYIVELSLVLDPADRSAQILNSLKEEQNMGNDPTLQDVLDAVAAIDKKVTESLTTITDQLSKLLGDDTKKDDPKDPSTDPTGKGADPEDPAKAAENARIISEMKKKWGNK